MERLSTQNTTQDASGGLALCYQLSQPVNVQSVDSQTAVAVQSLLDSQVVTEAHEEEEEDIFQCGKCKKQFTSLATFVSHKQTQCGALQQQQQPQQLQQPFTLQQPHQSQLTLNTGPSAFAPAISLSRPFSQTQLNGTISTINTGAPLLQAHPCLTRSLNQPSNAATLTLGGVPSSPMSQLSHNMVLTDDLMTLANIDTSALGGQTIQMVTGSLPGQTVSASNTGGMTIFSPVTSLGSQPAATFSTAGPAQLPPSQLLVQPAPQITLTTISPDNKILQQQQQPLAQQLHTIQPIQQQQLQVQQQQPQKPGQQQHHLQQATATLLSAAPGSQLVGAPTSVTPGLATQVVTQTAAPGLLQPAGQQQTQLLKQLPAKISKKTTQGNKFVTVLAPDNSALSLLSTAKGKPSKGGKFGLTVTASEESSKPKLKCEYCNKQFTKNFDLQQHIRAHTGEKPFQCIVCGRAFAQKSNVKKHMATHKVWPTGTSNTLPKQPSPVPEESTDATVLQSENVQIQTAVALSKAPTVVTNSGLLKKPGDQDNTEADKGDEDDEAEPRMKVVVDNSYICQYCPAKFTTYYQLKTHLVTHKSEQVYKCVMKSCGQSFPQLESFLEHIKSHESDMSYRCHQCNKYFKSLYDLGVHQYTHVYLNQGVKSGPRHFQCTKCGNKYTTPEALEHHMSTTTHDYKCPHCQKQFTCERFLRRHLPLHGTEGQFECQECKKKFKTEHYLKTHMLIHTGEMPFACELCPAAFNRKDKLKRHMTIHESVKKYRCPFKTIAGCLKEFNRPDKLKAHIITHSGIKPHKCSVCGKGFSRRPHLVEHERGHNLDFRYKCEKCGKGFFRPKLYAEHKCRPSSRIVGGVVVPVEQTFVPRNRRKMGRPRKRPVSISPDSLARTRGKQYLSRTRGKLTPRPLQQIPQPPATDDVPVVPDGYLSVKQRLRRQQQQKRLKAEMREAQGNVIGSRAGVVARDTVSVDVDGSMAGVAARDTVSVDVDGKRVRTYDNVEISSRADHHTVDPDHKPSSPAVVVAPANECFRIIDTQSISIVKDEASVDDDGVANCQSSQQIQQISLASGTDMVDHYVVHLTESVDGSGPTIQTAFIPAVSGGKIFASSAGGLGIQPIAIIEASSLSVGSSGIVTADTGGTIGDSEGQDGRLSVSSNPRGGDVGMGDATAGSFITITGVEGNQSLSEVVDDQDKSNIDLTEGSSTLIMLSDSGPQHGQAEEGDESSQHSGKFLAPHHHDNGSDGNNLLMSVETSDGGDIAMVEPHVRGDKLDEEEEEEMEGAPIMVMADHGLGGEQQGEDREMMEGALSLFEGRDSFVGGQVVVSGDQAYIACPAQLVDYGSTE